MPRIWGPWSATASSGARYRVGLDYTLSGVKVAVDQYVFESAFSIYKSVTLTRTGRLSGTYSPNVSTAGGVVSLGAGGSVNGTRGGSVTVGGRVTNILHGLTASVSVTIQIPAVEPSKPARPTISNVSSSGFRANLGSAPSNGGAAITRYEWQYEGGSWVNGTGSRNHDFSGLSADTSYRVRVRARNSAGVSTASDWSNAARTSPLAPNPPTNFTVTRVNDSQQSMTWTRNVSSGRPYSSQRVQRREWRQGAPVSGWVTVANLSGTATSYTDKSTVAARRYEYRVQALNGAGTSTSGTSIINTSPSAPSSVVATKEGNNIRLAITRTATYEGVGQLVIQHSADGGAWTVLATVNSTSVWTHVSPNPAQTHRYRVAARTNTANSLTGPYSSPSNTVQLQAPPNAPSNLAPNGAVVDASAAVRLSWRHNPVDTSAQSERQIRYRVTGDSSWTTLAAVSSSNQHQDVSAFENGETYEWQVRTRGDDPGWSAYSSTASFTASSAPTVAILAPIGVVDTSSIVAEWSYYDAEGTSQSRAEVDLVTDGESVEFRTVNGSASSLPLKTSLINGREYVLRVRVRDGSGLWSAWESQSFSVNFASPPVPTIAVDWDRDQGAAILSIDNPESLGTYEWEGIPGESASIKRFDGVEVGRNLARNPSFEYGLTGLATAGLIASSSTYVPALVSGSHAVNATTTSGSASVFQIIPVQPGDWVAARIPLRWSGGSRYVRIRIIPRDSDAAWLQPSEYSLPIYGENHYQFFTHSAQMPPEAVDAQVRVYFYDSPSYTDPETETSWHTDAWMIATGGTQDEAVEGVSEYFDGDTPGQVLATSNDVLRRVDGGEWVLIATDVPINATIIDPTPPLKGVVEYKARAWSDLPSSSDGEPVAIEWEHDQCPIFVNGGAQFSMVRKTRGHRTSDMFSIQQEKEHWAGNRLATGYWGEAEDYTFTFTANLLGDSSTRTEWRELLQQRGPVIYRDCQGRIIYGMLSVGLTGAGGVDEVSFTIDELETDEHDLSALVVS